jgi:ankyrin repeat protein
MSEQKAAPVLDLDTAITNAVFLGDIEKVREILESNPTLDVNKKYSFSKLIAYPKFKHENMVEGTLLHLVARNPFNEKTYCQAALDNMIPIASSLVNRGAKLDLIGSLGYSVLYRAIRSQHGNLVNFLLDAGVNPEEVYQGFTPIIFAAAYENRPAMKLLIHKKVNLNYLKSTTHSCLCIVCDYANDQSEMVELLLKNGADPNLGVSPLRRYAISSDSVDLLLKYGLKIKKDEVSPLFDLIATPNIPVIHRLLAMPGIDITGKNQLGETPLVVVANKVGSIKFPPPPTSEAELKEWTEKYTKITKEFDEWTFILRRLSSLSSK